MKDRTSLKRRSFVGLLLLTSSCVPAGQVPRIAMSHASQPRAMTSALSVAVPAVTVVTSPPPAVIAAAAPFELPDGTSEQLRRATDCLTAAIYYEARSEGEAGQRAVAQVVLNRVRHPAWPATICGVVYQGSERRTGCQFSFTCDGSLRARREAWAWAAARRIAQEALAGEVYRPVGLSTHYHTTQVNPLWGRRLAATTIIGAHIFYRAHGASGDAPAFSRRAPQFAPLPAAAPPIRLAVRNRPANSVIVASAQPGFELGSYEGLANMLGEESAGDRPDPAQASAEAPVVATVASLPLVPATN